MGEWSPESHVNEAYSYLQLTEYESCKGSGGHALLVRSPFLHGVVLMPGEFTPVVLDKEERAVLGAWVLLDDDLPGIKRRATLARVEATGHPHEEPWHLVVLVVAIYRASYEGNRRAASTPRLIQLDELEIDVPISNRTLRQLIGQNLTQIDSRLGLHIGYDESLIHNRLVEKLFSLGKRTIFPTGQAIDDPDLDLQTVLSLARSLLLDRQRYRDENEELERIFHDLDALQTGDVRCAWCRQSICAVADLLANRFAFHINRTGYYARLILSKRCQNGETDDDPETVDSWLSGYSWTSLTCTLCGNFLGFQFQEVGQAPSCIFGLISAQVL